MPLATQVCRNEYRFALALAPPTVSANNQFRLQTTNGRIAMHAASTAGGAAFGRLQTMCLSVPSAVANGAPSATRGDL